MTEHVFQYAYQANSHCRHVQDPALEAHASQETQTGDFQSPTHCSEFEAVSISNQAAEPPHLNLERYKNVIFMSQVMKWKPQKTYASKSREAVLASHTLLWPNQIAHLSSVPDGVASKRSNEISSAKLFPNVYF